MSTALSKLAEHRATNNLKAISDILVAHGIVQNPLSRKDNYCAAIASGLKQGLAHQLRPYIAWCLDHAHFHNTTRTFGSEYQLVRAVIACPELSDLMAPRLKRTLSRFLITQQNDSTSPEFSLRAEFIQPALDARDQPSLAPLVAPLVPKALESFHLATMVTAHAQLTLGWYGKDTNFSNVPGLAHIIEGCNPANDFLDRQYFIRQQCLNEPFVTLINAIQDSTNTDNRLLKKPLYGLYARNIEVKTKFDKQKIVPVIIDLSSPHNPVIFCNTNRCQPSDMLTGKGSPFSSKEWDISASLLFATHQVLDEISHLPQAQAACDASKAQSILRRLITRDPKLNSVMPETYRVALTGPLPKAC